MAPFGKWMSALHGYRGTRSRRSMTAPRGTILTPCAGRPSLLTDHTYRFLESVCWARHPSTVTINSVGCTRSEEHTSELQSLMRISYAVFCLKQKKTKT